MHEQMGRECVWSTVRVNGDETCILGDEGERLPSIGNDAGVDRVLKGEEHGQMECAHGVDEGGARVGNSVQGPRFIGKTEGKHSDVLEQQME